MKLIKSLLIISLTIFSNELFCNSMEEFFYSSGKIYVVIGVVSIVLLGLGIFLFLIERRLNKLEEKTKSL
jgi:hypothetical protein